MNAVLTVHIFKSLSKNISRQSYNQSFGNEVFCEGTISQKMLSFMYLNGFFYNKRKLSTGNLYSKRDYPIT